MALDPVPWFVGGGAEHSPDVARLVLHIATGGAAGVVSPTDLRVTQLPAATSSIRIAAGAAVIPNIHAIQQSYGLRAPSITDLAVSPTGSVSARSDMVVAYIEDPQFTGEELPEAERANGPYVFFDIIEGVGSTATTVPGTFDRPAIPLARITLPPNTAAVTDAMITDLRKVATPKRTRDLYNTQPTSTTTTSDGTYKDICPQGARTITIPSWATQMKVIGHLAGAVVSGGDFNGNLGPVIGSTNLASNALNIDAYTRSTHMVSDTWAIPASVRGTNQTLKLFGNKTGGTGSFSTDAYTTMIWDVEFLEAASAD